MTDTLTATPVTTPSGRSPKGIRGIFMANLVAQTGIVVTGAVVRITESGLGCPTWPECVDGSIAPTAAQEESWHKYIEFGNRLLTFVLVILAVAAIVAAPGRPATQAPRGPAAASGPAAAGRRSRSSAPSPRPSSAASPS